MTNMIDRLLVLACIVGPFVLLAVLLVLARRDRDRDAGRVRVGYVIACGFLAVAVVRLFVGSHGILNR